MNKKISACIFDLDGVIVDTAKFHFIAWQELAKELGFEFTQKDNERLKGVSRMRSLDILLEIGGINLSDEKKNEIAKIKNERYVKLIKTLKPEDILPGALIFLKELKAKGIKIALGSASKNAMMILENLKIVDIFDSIVDGTKVSKAKPNPEVFLIGAKELGSKAEECLVFEDSQAGIEAAKAANMFVIGIGNEENLTGADFLIPGFLDFTFEDVYKKIK